MIILKIRSQPFPGCVTEKFYLWITLITLKMSKFTPLGIFVRGCCPLAASSSCILITLSLVTLVMSLKTLLSEMLTPRSPRSNWEPEDGQSGAPALPGQHQHRGGLPRAALSLVRGPQYSALIGWSRASGPGADTDTEPRGREGVLWGSGNQIMGDTVGSKLGAGG